jgi:hypothetical protein
MPGKAWGLFGGKWEAKTDFKGHCGQIIDPIGSLYSCWYWGNDCPERIYENPPARTGSQEVTGLIPVSSTRISKLQESNKIKIAIR